jgi:hypothetical protein
MSEATEEPMVCVDCGGTMTDEDAFSLSLGEESVVYWHMERSGCIASLGERLTAATKRAEAAEAERDALRKDNEVLREEVQMQLMELGMKGIGDRMSQYLRSDDECNKCAAMEAKV